jgi:UDP-glucose 4-epimerase
VGRVAVTGTASFVGGRVLQALADHHGPEAVVAIDPVAPAAAPGVAHRDVDLAEPGADRRLAEVFREEEIEAVVHAAFFTNPRRDRALAHEIESIGTLNVMGAAAAAGVGHVVMRSFTFLYGARGQNPSLLTESQPVQAEGPWWVRDKVEAEQHATDYARRYPKLVVTLLRLAPVLGANVDNFYSRLLAKPVVPVVFGYDPLIQLLHPEDAASAFVAALLARPAGPVNVVPRDAVSLKALLHLAGRLTVPVIHPLAHAAADLLWSAGLAEAPGAFVDYARFPCVADGGRARREMAFEPRFGSRDALFDFLGSRDDTAGEVARLPVRT